MMKDTKTIVSVRVKPWMTILVDKEILHLVESKRIIIAPFLKQNLTTAGYDFSSGISCDLNPKQQKLIVTAERLEIPANILGTIHLKSSLCREGLIGSFAVIDPGFRGNLTLLLFNSGDSSIRINKNEPIAQIIFHKTEGTSSKPYNGRYQDSVGLVESRRKIRK
jgi:dCTP deaminase